jgi:hypothetical protein
MRSRCGLYSEETPKAMTGLKWLNRGISLLKPQGELVKRQQAYKPGSKLKGYSTVESKSRVIGVSQRWILVEAKQGLNQNQKFTKD